MSHKNDYCFELPGRFPYQDCLKAKFLVSVRAMISIQIKDRAETSSPSPALSQSNDSTRCPSSILRTCLVGGERTDSCKEVHDPCTNYRSFLKSRFWKTEIQIIISDVL